MKRLPQLALMFSAALLLAADEPQQPGKAHDRKAGVAVEDVYETPRDSRLVVSTPADPAEPRRLFETNEVHEEQEDGRRPVGRLVIGDSQYLGFRFRVGKSLTTARVGGYLGGEGRVFAALVALSGPEDFPDSIDLSTADVLGHTLITLSATARLVGGGLSVSLSPGWYAVVFGSGRFAATGEGYSEGAARRGTFEGLTSTPRGPRRGWCTSFGRQDHYFVDVAGTPPGVLANDRAAKTAGLTARLVAGPKNGALKLNSDGTFLYRPNLGFVGIDSFTYAADDGFGNASEALVRIQVGGRAMDDRYTVDEDKKLEVSEQEGRLAKRGKGGQSPILVSKYR